MPDHEPHHDWISVGEFANSASAEVESTRLTIEGVPHRIMPSAFPIRDPTCWIWVPPEWVDKAKELLSHDAVPEDELTKLALSTLAHKFGDVFGDLRQPAQARPGRWSAWPSVGANRAG